MGKPLDMIPLIEALATASITTHPRPAFKNSRFLGPCEIHVERAASVGGGTVYGQSRLGQGNVARQDFVGDGSATVYDSALAYVAFSNHNWLLFASKSTRTGTVTVTAGSKTVTGSGTNFDPELNVGDEIMVNGEIRTVEAIASDTVLTVDQAFVAAAAAVAIHLIDGLLIPTTDFALSSNGGLCRITLTAAAKLPLGAKLELHYVGTPRTKMAFADATVITRKREVAGDEFLWYASDATATPSATNVYARAIGK